MTDNAYNGVLTYIQDVSYWSPCWFQVRSVVLVYYHIQYLIDRCSVGGVSGYSEEFTLWCLRCDYLPCFIYFLFCILSCVIYFLVLGMCKWASNMYFLNSISAKGNQLPHSLFCKHSQLHKGRPSSMSETNRNAVSWDWQAVNAFFDYVLVNLWPVFAAAFNVKVTAVIVLGSYIE